MEKFDELLIAYVERCPHLYKKDDKNYKDDGMKQNSWVSIASKLGCEPDKVKKRWENLRTNFVRAYRIYSEKAPSGSDAKPKKITFMYFQVMMWLAPYIRKEKLTSSHRQRAISEENVAENFNSNTETEEEEIIIETQSQINEDDEERPHTPSPLPAEWVTYEVEEDSGVPAAPSYSRSTPSLKRICETPSSNKTKSRKNVPTELTAAVEAFTTMVQYKTKAINSVAPVSEDPSDEAFMKSVISDMKQIKAEHKIKFKLEVMQLLCKYTEM